MTTASGDTAPVFIAAPAETPLEIPEATRSALDDRDMTIAQVDDTVVVTTSTGVTLDDTTLSGAIAEVTVAIAADTEIISEDR